MLPRDNVPRTWSERLYLGTWQLGGQFRPLTPAQVEALLRAALDHGIGKFDTAGVYGGGSVETALGRVLPRDGVVVTKVPAKVRPAPEAPGPVERYYDRDWIAQWVEGSLRRLGRSQMDVVLLHNWARNWGRSFAEPLAVLDEFRHQGMLSRVGISLPDGFDAALAPEIAARVDVIEAPYNPLDEWIIPALPDLARMGKEVILRSLLIQGMLVMDQERRRQLPPTDGRQGRLNRVRHLEPRSVEAVLAQVWKLGTSVTIGMTTPGQIAENVRFLAHLDAGLLKEE